MIRTFSPALFKLLIDGCVHTGAVGAVVSLGGCGFLRSLLAGCGETVPRGPRGPHGHYWAAHWVWQLGSHLGRVPCRALGLGRPTDAGAGQGFWQDRAVRVGPAGWAPERKGQ